MSLPAEKLALVPGGAAAPAPADEPSLARRCGLPDPPAPDPGGTTLERARALLEAAARAVLVRHDGAWIAFTPRGGQWVELGRARTAAPLARALEEEGWSVRFAFEWHRRIARWGGAAP